MDVLTPNNGTVLQVIFFAGLVAALIGGYGFEQLKPLLQFVLALYAACAFHIIVVYGGLLLAHGLSPLKFFKGAFPAMQVGFVAASSFAAMPVSLRCTIHSLGVNSAWKWATPPDQCWRMPRGRRAAATTQPEE